MAARKEDTEKATRKTETKRRKRRRDTSLGSYKQKMTLPTEVHEWAKKEDKVLRWVNDQRGKLHYAQANDWDFVKYQGGTVGEVEQPENIGDCYSMVVGSDNGRDITAYLMAKNRDWYEDDQAEKQKDVDEIDRAIHEGTAANPSAEDAQYVKDIKYEPKGRLRS